MLVEQQNNDGDDGQRFELQEDPSFWKDNSVQVVIRLRPLSSSEISLQGYNTCVRQDSCHSITWIGHPESRFTFDLVVDEHISQEDLFKVAGVPMVENCVAGYNSCMFAYGQTGSGKTHTMLGDIEGGTRRHSVNCGMTPRVFEYLFTRIQKEKESRRDEKLRFTCKCSFLEIYNEQILDLLDPSTLNLQIREDAKKGVYVENLKEFEVSSARDVMQHLIQGAANRKVAATNMNRASSRSHSVFNCSIESKWESQGVTHLRFARLNLVDLAGSERQKSSGAEGERLKEATNINKSLSTLGLVIMNLVHVSSKKAMHVPYRDSKLTFLLQDSLGGNSKTTIIANISPSNCCALETLSTLKFAQRAKFIRNNAIVNEDASGDILSMRLQIQHLKKEVNRLQGLVHGADNQDGDNLSTHFPGSPGSFKWDGGQGLFSPLISDKRFSKKREDEASLVAAFRRDQDKESTLKALVAEKEAAEQLANQRTEEVKGLKMRLRFREEGIKRLEGVASGKLSAETHLLQERGELMKEIEILRNQVDRNPEVTRFAMENLQLKEELRRLQSFVEEGEREMMNEQITALQDKLLEALDWKLMHEKDPVIQDPSLSWDSSINEENEFLRMEAIKNQREVEALRINLNFCLEAKEKLERRVIDLVSELEEETKSKNAVNETSKFQQTCQPIASSSDEQPDNQMQLKTMVDAIATASQREAEAHETAIVLAKENEDLRGKLKVLIEDNNKLIELYESIAAEGNTNKDDNALQEENTEDLTGCLSDVVGDKYGHELRNQEIKDAEHLECQLIEMHEENEKLMNLYEQAMRERDEFKKMLCSTEQSCVDIKEIGCVEKLVEVDEEKVNGSGNVGENLKVHVKFLEVSEEKLHLAKEKLELVQDKLLTVAGDISILGLIEKASIEFENISEKTEAVDQDIQLKQQEIISLELTYSEIQERKLVMDNKFLALKSALPKFSSNVESWGEREAQARARVEAHSGFVLQKKEELAQLQSSKNEIDGTFVKDEQSEAQMRDNFRTLSSKFQDYEAQRRETERVLFGIDNLNRTEVSTQRTLQFGKASEMLKAEVERTKLAAEMKLLKEKIAAIEKKKVSARKMSESLDTKIQIVDEELRKGFQSLEESQIELQKVTGEKILLSEKEETGRSEVEKLFIDYQECVFDLDLKEAELRMCREDLQLDMKSLEEFRAAQTLAIQKMNHLMDQSRQHSLTISDSGDHLQYVSQKLECELGYVQNFVHEAKSLLLFNSNNR